MKKRISDVKGHGKGNDSVQKAREVSEEDLAAMGRVAMIQALIPLGLMAVEEELAAEVERLAGKRYAHTGSTIKRWGSNRGSVFLGDQRVSVKVPRVRDAVAGREVGLNSYQALRDPGVIDNAVLGRVLNGISARKYEKVAMMVPETFGIKKSSVSRRFVKAARNKLGELLERDLSGHDIVAVFIDGKSFAENSMILALGVTMEGDKVVLGFIESATENHKVVRDFINGLVDRGLRTDNEILFVIDGSKGIRKGIKEVLGDKAVIQRCQWHKRENVVSYLELRSQPVFRRKLQAAYEQETYEKAKRRLSSIERELKLVNESAASSLMEGLEETLTLHRLGMFKKLGTSFKTTNCIENLNRQLGIYTGRVSHWRNSDQRRRWVATALLEIEPAMRKVKGYKYMMVLRSAMRRMSATAEKKSHAA